LETSILNSKTDFYSKTDFSGKTGIRVKTYRSIAEVNEGEWDAIVGKDRILCTHKYIEALEKSGVNEGRCYYPVVYDGDEIIAHASVYFISTELDLCAQGAIKKIINLVRRKWKNFFILRSLECGPPISVGNAISFKDGVNRAETFRLVCHEIESLAKGLGINFILFRDFYNEEMEFYDLLKERGYMKIHNLPKAEIKIRWKTFDEYLNSMRSNYRYKIVKRIDKCAKANISIRVVKNFSDNTPELKRLYDNVYNHAKEIKRERLTESFFQNINKYLGEKAVIISAMKDDRLIGYMLLLFSGKTLISKFPGLDYDCNQECCIYFNLFYKTIELAIETGMDDVDMGITTLDPKKDMGSSIVTLNMYMRHSNPLLNKIIPRLFGMITPQDTEPRNVFKV
jgi:predicted N-acyltransferase